MFSKINNNPLIILSNYGDESIALIQWLFEAKLTHQPIEVVSIDTGWASPEWKGRIALGEKYAKACGFKTTHIISAIPFAEAVKGRGEFPSAKFQWCSALLKGLPFLEWLDTWDLDCKAIILLAKRRQAAKAQAELEEWLEKSEFYNGRTVWHPIINLELEERNALLQRAGFLPLNHRSLECNPCVNNSFSDFARLQEGDIQKVLELEKLYHSPMFASIQDLGIIELIEWAKENPPLELEDHYLDLFYRGCGNHFGCGL